MKRASLFDGRAGGVAAKRRQWAAALVVSFAAHLLVLAGLVAEIDRPPPPPVQPPVTVTLERPIRLPKPPEPKPVETPAPLKTVPPKAPPPPPPPIPFQRPVQAPQPVAPPAPPPASSGVGRAPAAAAPSIATGRTPNGDETANANCIAQNMEKMNPKERLACETHIIGFMDKYEGKTPTVPPGSALDPEKRAAYEAALAKKHYKNAPVTHMGNAGQTAASCKQANIGDGCQGDTTIPVYTKPF